jgi:hypothetical protein
MGKNDKAALWALLLTARTSSSPLSGFRKFGSHTHHIVELLRESLHRLDQVKFIRMRHHWLTEAPRFWAVAVVDFDEDLQAR